MLVSSAAARKYLMDGLDEKSETRVEAENGCAHPTYKLMGSELVPDVSLPAPCEDICVFKDVDSNQWCLKATSPHLQIGWEFQQLFS